ncbi:sulfotransferase [Roseivirga sp.]|uniref:sulfotransferase n=1 Tax=Roseivirga sp. TaxID=1964215 RepID=UPI003B8CBA6B
MNLVKRARRKVKQQYVRWRFAKAQKIFCIGKNKTGTSSLKHFFKQAGFVVGSQKEAEQFIFDWHKGQYANLIEYVTKNGQFFQDVPFSLSPTYRILDEAFPDSKFILTIRDNPQKWYASLINFHSKLWGNGHIPSKEDLQKATYRYPGYAWEAFKCINETPENDLYNKEIMIAGYESHNKQVIEYFRQAPEKLLVINLSDPDASKKLKAFLNLSHLKTEIPWENKTLEIKAP